MFLTGATLTASGVLEMQATLGQPIDVPLIVGGSAMLFLLVAARLASMNVERTFLDQRLAFCGFHGSLTHLLTFLDPRALSSLRFFGKLRGSRLLVAMAGAPESLRLRTAGCGHSRPARRGRIYRPGRGHGRCGGSGTDGGAYPGEARAICSPSEQDMGVDASI